MDALNLGPILEELAAGTIDAAQAAARIEELRAGAAFEPSAEHLLDEPISSGEELPPRRQYAPFAKDVFEREPERPSSAEESGRHRSGSRGVERISVRAVGRRVRIVGDPTVATVSADGPHLMRRNGSVLEVSSDGEFVPGLDGFSMLRPPRNLDEIRNLGLGKELHLRVNPAVIVDVEVTAGHLTCTDVPWLGRVRVTAGGADLTGLAEVDDALIQAGMATVKGTITTGRSRVRVESGQLTVDLAPNSNVTVHGEAQLGRISWQPEISGQVDEVVIGNGSARLDVGVVMGWANVRIPSEVER